MGKQNQKCINDNKIVVFSGAGLSNDSGLDTFRGSGGFWQNYRIEGVASPVGWRNDPEQVIEFYNRRKAGILQAEPNAAHLAIAELEARYEVVVVTQNIDNLHERAGSSNVIHLHGEITKARSTLDDDMVYDIGNDFYSLENRCEKNSVLRPHVVWFGEWPYFLDEAEHHFQTARRILVVGTSLDVMPAAGLLISGRHHAEKLIVTMELDRHNRPYGYRWLRGKAANLVPSITQNWLQGRRAI